MDEKSANGGYSVDIKITWVWHEINRIKEKFVERSRYTNFQIQEETHYITLFFGNPTEMQLILRGMKKRKNIFFSSGQVVGSRLNDGMLSKLLGWICNFVSQSDGMIGLIITRDGHQSRPIVIRDGEIYDMTRMMDLLWENFSATRIRESRRMEDVYYFLRDVPPD